MQCHLIYKYKYWFEFVFINIKDIIKFYPQRVDLINQYYSYTLVK